MGMKVHYYIYDWSKASSTRKKMVNMYHTSTPDEGEGDSPH